jgi:hypothetical protein
MAGGSLSPCPTSSRTWARRSTLSPSTSALPRQTSLPSSWSHGHGFTVEIVAIIHVLHRSIVQPWDCWIVRSFNCSPLVNADCQPETPKLTRQRSRSSQSRSSEIHSSTPTTVTFGRFISCFVALLLRSFCQCDPSHASCGLNFVGLQHHLAYSIDNPNRGVTWADIDTKRMRPLD